MTPLVIILGPKGAGRRATARVLAENAWPEGKHIRIFQEARDSDGSTDTWQFQNQQALIPSPGDETAAILITHGGLPMIEQMEALHRTLQPGSLEAPWQLQRIITVVDCPLTQRHPDVEKWYESCIHFSDTVIFRQRWELPGAWASQFLRPYQDDFYPCLFMNFLKNGQLPNVMQAVEGAPLRRTHIFDEIDAVDEMEFDEDNLPSEPFDLVRQPDKYFARDELGRRKILVPDITEVLRQEGRL
jgi:hypothetical protein